MRELDIPDQDIATLPIRLWETPYVRAAPKDALHRQLATALGCAPHALPLARNPHGRPHLEAPYMDYDLSWSHSEEWLLLALGKAVRLGIDIEKLRGHPRALDLARRFFHPSEADQLQQSHDVDGDFFRLWCAKEAILKAHGRGIAFGLDRAVFALDPAEDTPHLLDCDQALGRPTDWHLRLWRPHPGYLAVLAWRWAAGRSDNALSIIDNPRI